MVPGVVIVGITAVLTAVPDFLERPHSLGPFAVELLEEALVHGFAVTPTGLPHLQGGEQQIFLAVKDVYQVAQGPGIESRRLHMDVDTAGGVGEGPLVTELPHQFLNGGEVLVGADGATISVL